MQAIRFRRHEFRRTMPGIGGVKSSGLERVVFRRRAVAADVRQRMTL